MWIKLKRLVLILIGAVVVFLGGGSAVSALLGYYGTEFGAIAGGALFGLLLAALGGLLVWVGFRGTDKDVSDTDLI